MIIQRAERRFGGLSSGAAAAYLQALRAAAVGKPARDAGGDAPYH